MGLVQFETSGNGEKPGFLLDEKVVDLTSVSSLDVTETGNVFERFSSVSGLETHVLQALSASEPITYTPKSVAFCTPFAPERLVRLEGCYEHDVTDEGFNPHLERHSLNDRDHPTMWIAPKASLHGPRSKLTIPRHVKDIRPGVELAFVIGDPNACDPYDRVAGCTVAITFAAYDETPGIDGYKMYEGFLTIGPEICDIDSDRVQSVSLELHREETVTDVRSTSQWRFSVSDLIEYVASVMTLRPGDVVVTGDPTRSADAIAPGEVITGEVSGIEALTTEVAETGA